MPQGDLKEFLFKQRNFFKLSTLIILFLLIIIQFFGLILQSRIFPEALSVVIAFICIIYLWLAEQKDIERLQRSNIGLLAAQEELKTSHIDTVMALVLSQEAKDHYTYGHSERVRQYSVIIAQELKLPEHQVMTIARGAKLHDIGKIGIKDEILFSDGKLTSEQYDVIKTHPLKGVAILEPLKFLEREKLIVRHHHERYDGAGYPDKLKGEEIPLEARIVGVADAFDAMRSRRRYRSDLSKEEIIMQLVSNSGTQFDPKVVDVFVRNIDRFYV
ncbi:MAG: HD-GYP domain-containing protein [Candidatus Omnitrophota bacterium]